MTSPGTVGRSVNTLRHVLHTSSTAPGSARIERRGRWATVPTKVVVAEDEAIIRMDLRELLQEEGYEVVGYQVRKLL